MLIETQEQALKRQDPRIKRTRHLLQQAMMDLMMEKSFQVITVQDIAERATVNRATFYAHFEDKYALLEYTMREMFRQRLHSQLPEDSLFSPENMTKLLLMVCMSVSEVNRHCPMPLGQLEPLMEKQIKEELYEILHRWLVALPADTSPKRPTPEQAAMVTSWAIYGAAMQWSQQGQTQPMEEFVQQVFPMISASFEPVTR
jgi:AcrR family transcriptional regulator